MFSTLRHLLQQVFARSQSHTLRSRSTAFGAAISVFVFTTSIVTAEVPAATATAPLTKVADADAQRFVSILQSEVRAARKLQPELPELDAAITRFVTSEPVPVELAAKIVAADLRAQMAARENKADSTPVTVTQATAMVLLPYMMRAGMCDGSISTPSGLVCGFLNTPDGAYSEASRTDALTGVKTNMAEPPANSELARIFALADASLNAKTQARGSEQNASSRSIEQCTNGFNFKITYGLLVVVRLDEEDIAKLIAAAVAAYYGQTEIAKAIIESIELDFYGEGYLAANIQYAVTSSDSAFALYPYGLSCTIKECVAAARCASRAENDDDLKACMDEHTEKGFWDLRPAGSSIGHRIVPPPVCMTFPVPAQSRPPFLAVQSGVVPVRVLGENLRFQTKHQSGSSDPGIAATGVHLFPTPNEFQVDFPLRPKWTYRFDKVRSWDYNLLYAGLESANFQRTCGTAETQEDKVAFGDAFWSWHGQKNDHGFLICTPNSDLRACLAIDINPNGNNYPMPTVDLIWGQFLGHPPITCGLTPAETPAVLLVSPPAIAATESHGFGSAQVAINFLVSRAGDLSKEVKVKYATTDLTAIAGLDYQATAGELVFKPGQVNMNVSVPVIGDRTTEQTETFTMNLSRPTGATIALNGLATGTIVDDDPAKSNPLVNTPHVCNAQRVSWGDCSGLAPKSVLYASGASQTKGIVTVVHDGDAGTVGKALFQCTYNGFVPYRSPNLNGDATCSSVTDNVSR